MHAPRHKELDVAPDSGNALPDTRGWFGDFGGRFVPETLMHALDELTVAYEAAKADPKFQE